MVGVLFFVKAGSLLSGDSVLPIPGDLIVILGGDSGARSLRGVELYRKGFGKTILLTGLEDAEEATQPYYLNWRAQFLISAGVSKNRIILEKTLSRNTWDEAQHTLVLAKQHGWRSIIVVSDPPHLRRLQWVWGRTFKGSGINIYPCASHPSWWDEKHWWSNELSVKFVIMEYLKMPYYLIKYK